MRLSKFFLPLLRDTSSKEIELESYKLMIRAGLIRKLDKGLYTWLPLGLRIMDKIIKIIDSVMLKYDFNKINMPCIQPASLWIKSGRYDAYGAEMLKISDRHKKDLLFGPTHEEVISDLIANNQVSYKNYPIKLYQITNKFRDEIRPRFGVMRGREFLMKDGYSFDVNIEQSKKTYYEVFESYEEIFNKLGLNVFAASADNGAIGGDMSHEFHILSSVGESTLYFDKKLLNKNLTSIEKRSLYCATNEKHEKKINTDEKKEQAQAKESNDLISSKSIEVGHIFNFGTKYSSSMKVHVQDENQKQILVEMGSYGIGVSRLVAAIIERSEIDIENTSNIIAGYDRTGIIWPISIAPFLVSIIYISQDDEVKEAANEIYNQLNRNIHLHNDVLLDDSNNRGGEKFIIHNLIGIPYQIIINKENLLNNKVEIKERKTQKITLLEIAKIEQYLQQCLEY